MPRHGKNDRTLLIVNGILVRVERRAADSEPLGKWLCRRLHPVGGLDLWLTPEQIAKADKMGDSGVEPTCR